MAWATLISKKAIDIVMGYERRLGRNPGAVDKAGVGHDIHSKSATEERFIEVKGVSESWKTYTWQPLHSLEYKCLRSNPSKFYLYIVYFDIPSGKRNDQVLFKAPYTIYTIPGTFLLNKEIFSLEPETYALRPISKKKLKSYRAESLSFGDRR